MSNYEKIKITDLKPAAYNPRVISEDNFNKLKQSLGNYGLVDPIVINLKNQNTIIGGHQRYKALLEDGNKELYLLRLGDIGWVFDNPNMQVENEEKEKLLNITLNQDNMMGEWDNRKLETIFTDLELNDINLELTGFEDWEIDEISLNVNNTIFDSTQDEHMNTPISPVTETPREEPKKQETPTEDEDYDEDEFAIPDDEPELDESIADDIPTIKCPNCGYELPKK